MDTNVSAAAARMITRAKVQLILNQPFFATIALKLKFIEDDRYPTACTNGREIRYNPNFISGGKIALNGKTMNTPALTLEETTGLICHEVMHVAHLHHTRRAGRDPRKWNEAADYAINPLILAGGLKLPEGLLINKEFDKMSTERIYNLLPKPEEGSDGDGASGTGGGTAEGGTQIGGEIGDGQGDSQPWGEVEDGGSTAEELRQAEAEAQELIAQAANAAKMAGKLSADMKRLISEILEPVINWKAVLQQYILEIARNDYNFQKPNRRYLQSGFLMPSLENEEPGKIVLIVDTSASIDNELLNKFAGEMQEIAGTLNTDFSILWVDSEYKGMQIITPDETLNLQPKGGGGTCFRPGFAQIEKQNMEPGVCVYFTDGEASTFPAAEPDYPVLWAVYNNNNFSPPFGDVLKVDQYQ